MPPDDADGAPAYASYRITVAGDHRPDLEWIGVAGGDHDDRPRLFDPASETAYKGEIDHDHERVEVDPASGRDVDESAIAIEVELIDEWEWLSPYAREHADDDVIADR